MSLRLYNTLSRKKEAFEPIVPGEVNMYVCGPTVYNFISIGNSRPIVVFNMIRNYLKYLDYKVSFVQNITDIEDKIINKANEEGVDYKVITERYIKAFNEDLKGLEIGDFDSMPLATEMIDQIISIISKIIENGYGYEIEGNVYFDVARFDGYGKLSGQKIEEMKDEGDSEYTKKSRIDFALWKKAKEGEPSWDSPWGKGRPGWHIECSAMSTDILDHKIDIHGGGIDLVFPHHENEIAQSEAAFPEKGGFAKYWMHNGMIEVKSEKMSKSQGLKDDWILKNLLKKYSPDIIKIYILSTHYRSPLEFSNKKMIEASKALDRIINTLKNIDFLLSETDDKSGISGGVKEASRLKEITEFAEKGFREDMDDDFNSAGAIGVIFEMVKNINSIIQNADFKISDLVVSGLKNSYGKIVKLCAVLGLDPEKGLGKGKDPGNSESKEIQDFIDERNHARKDRDFKKADGIRDLLLSRGIILEDRNEGTIWKYKDK
ncbi:cysteine--tRNA ligase [Actinomycetota bacterium]